MSAKQLQNTISPKFTEQVLLEIVTKKTGLTDVQVEKIKIGAPSKKGDSYLSHICRFILEATGKNTKGQAERVVIPVIVKYLPTNLGRRKTYRSTDFFENEMIFYDEVWTAFQQFQESRKIKQKFDNIPLVLSAWIDGAHDYVAMLDLSYEGYTSADRGSGLNHEHTIAILRLFAGFHGLSLAFKDQQPEAFEAAASSLKETYFAEKYRKWYGNFQDKVFSIFRDAVEQELPPIYLDKLNKLIANDFYGELCKLCEVRGPLAVVTHGDVWVPNFLIQYDDAKPKKITMIDFQLTRYTTLATDLLFFLYSCVDLDLLKHHWDELIVEYHKALSENLERFGSDRNLVTLEALQAEIKASMAFGIGMSMEALIMCQLDDDDVSDLDAIKGDEAVPLESVWLIHPFKEQEKRKRCANMIQLAVDKNYI